MKIGKNHGDALAGLSLCYAPIKYRLESRVDKYFLPLRNVYVTLK